jgi:N-acetylglucosaminyldiphosphoundecaprenol N-acetyl-beta-D-mannosaminyltransferase
MYLLDYKNILYTEQLDKMHAGKLLINTINANAYVTACQNNSFQTALSKSNILLPDGISIVMAMKLLTGKKYKKIAGNDLFTWEMQRLERTHGTCFFLGSSNQILHKIAKRCKVEYPNITVSHYSPPYKPAFSKEDTEAMIAAVNKVSPDVLFIGMTAPKQEEWAAENFEKVKAQHVCSIGAVFDFYAGTINRAPLWIINLGFEWLYRFMQEPKRMWRRYLVGNTTFIALIVKEKWLTLFKYFQ